MCNHLCSLLGNFEVFGFEVREEVTTLKILHDDVDIVGVLKDIVESNDVRMLADFEHFDFSFEQLDIFKGKFFFLDDLHSYFFARFFVLSSLDEAVLTFTEGLFKLVEVVQVGVSNCLLNLVYPLVSLNQSVQVVYSPLVGEDQHEWV